MPISVSGELGNISVTNDIIATIAGYATIENYGIVGMASQRITADGIAELLGRENLKKGVVVTTVEDRITIDLYVIVEYGVSISAVAQNVIQNVTYRIKDLTGFIVEAVNVHVEGVRVQQS